MGLNRKIRKKVGGGKWLANDNADALVTGDNGLLVLKDVFKNPPIISLSEFEQWQKS